MEVVRQKVLRTILPLTSSLIAVLFICFLYLLLILLKYADCASITCFGDIEQFFRTSYEKGACHQQCKNMFVSKFWCHLLCSY